MRYFDELHHTKSDFQNDKTWLRNLSTESCVFSTKLVRIYELTRSQLHTNFEQV